jgi:hypothetical protein
MCACYNAHFFLFVLHKDFFTTWELTIYVIGNKLLTNAQLTNVSAFWHTKKNRTLNNRDYEYSSGKYIFSWHDTCSNEIYLKGRQGRYGQWENNIQQKRKTQSLFFFFSYTNDINFNKIYSFICRYERIYKQDETFQR